LSLYTPKPGEQDPRLLIELRAIQRSIEELYPKVKQFSPTILDSSGSNSEGQTYGSLNGGDYFRFGDIIFIRGRLDVAGLGTLTTSDATWIGGFPYKEKTDLTTSWVHGAISIGYANGIALGANYLLTGYFESLQPMVKLQKVDTTSGNTSDVAISEISAAGDIIFSGWYITNDKP